jgi:glutathione S-transferase
MDTLRNTAAGLKSRALPGPHDYEQIPELAERGRNRLEHFLRDMDARLSGRMFVAGERYTLADISAMIVVDFAGRLKVAISDECTNLKRWYAAVSARPSAKA